MVNINCEDAEQNLGRATARRPPDSNQQQTQHNRITADEDHPFVKIAKERASAGGGLGLTGEHLTSKPDLVDECRRGDKGKSIHHECDVVPQVVSRKTTQDSAETLRDGGCRTGQRIGGHDSGRGR